MKKQKTKATSQRQARHPADSQRARYTTTVCPDPRARIAAQQRLYPLEYESIELSWLSVALFTNSNPRRFEGESGTISEP